MNSPMDVSSRGLRSSVSPLSAVARVELTRARLRAAMAPEPAATPSHSLRSSWFARLESLPVVSAVLDSVRGWWTQHPLSTMTVVAGEASTAIARPIARSHPYALVLIAAGVGAVLAWRRPWRWILKPALFAGLVPRVVSRVVRKLPINSWMTVLDSTLFGPPRTSARGQANPGTPKTFPA